MSRTEPQSTEKGAQLQVGREKKWTRYPFQMGLFESSGLWKIVSMTFPWKPGHKGLEMNAASQERLGVTEINFSWCTTEFLKKGIIRMLNLTTVHKEWTWGWTEGPEGETSGPWVAMPANMVAMICSSPMLPMALKNLKGVSAPPVLWSTLTKAAERQGVITGSQCRLVADLCWTSELGRPGIKLWLDY